MSTTITAQPGAAVYGDPVFAISGNQAEALQWLTPGVPTKLDFLSMVPEVCVNHVLFPKTPVGPFLPSEYHVTTTDGKMLFVGKEVEEKGWKMEFSDSTGSEALTLREGVSKLSCKCSGVNYLPLVFMSAHGQDIGSVDQKKSGCSEKDLVYRDASETESPYSVPSLRGSVVLRDPYFPINENGIQVGTITSTISAWINRRESIVHFKIAFPPGADARLKAGLIASVVKMDIDLYSPMSRRRRGTDIGYGRHVGGRHQAIGPV